MTMSKLLSVFIVFVLILGTASIKNAAAGEKVKATCTSINTKWHQIKIDDVEGHVIAVYENKQVWVSEITGVRTTAVSKGVMDFNIKNGQGTMKGYTVMTYPDGDKSFTSYEGKRVGKGISKGTYSYQGGTGKYKGCTGGGTWEGKALERGIAHVAAEGERIYPEK